MGMKLANKLSELRQQGNMHGYAISLIGGDGINSCNEIEISKNDDMHVIDHARTLDAEDIDMLIDLMQNYTMKDIKEVFSFLSPSDTLGEYVKDSYQFSKDNLLNVFEQAVKGSQTAMNLYASVDNRKDNFDFSVYSAFLYKGFYVTPCILEAVISEYASHVSPNALYDFMTKYGYAKNEKKRLYQDMITDYFVSDNKIKFIELQQLAWV